MTDPGPLDGPLPEGIRSRFVHNNNGLRVHTLEAGFEGRDRPCVVLLHGFPELAYSWRKIMAPLASAGFHVIAPDQRGYGRTTGWDTDYDGDLASFRFLMCWAPGLADCNAWRRFQSHRLERFHDNGPLPSDLATEDLGFHAIRGRNEPLAVAAVRRQ